MLILVKLGFTMFKLTPDEGVLLLLCSGVVDACTSVTVAVELKTIRLWFSGISSKKKQLAKVITAKRRVSPIPAAYREDTLMPIAVKSIILRQ